MGHGLSAPAEGDVPAEHGRKIAVGEVYFVMEGWHPMTTGTNVKYRPASRFVQRAIDKLANKGTVALGQDLRVRSSTRIGLNGGTQMACVARPPPYSSTLARASNGSSP
jgi:hypothetical protein